MATSRQPKFRFAAAIFAGLSAASAALAQTASQVTPAEAVPPTQPLRGALVFSGAPGLAAPAGAERLTILVGDVAVEGTLPGMEVPTEALRQRLTAGRIRASELFEAAAELEQAYANEGYVLARVVLPRQRLVDGGTLRLQVVDGFVESVDLRAAPAPVRDRLAALTDPLVGRRGLTLSELERQILLAGDTYGVALGSALQAGASPGGTVVILDPEYRGVTGFAGLDNSLSDSLGGWKFDTGVELNGLLGFGESLYARLSGHPEGDFAAEPVLRTLSFGAVVPLGTDGLTLNLEHTISQTNPEEIDPDIPSEFERSSVRLFYPWVRSRDFNLTTRLSFDAQRDRLDVDTAAGAIPVYEDDLRILRLAADAFWQTETNATIEVGSELSFGLDCCGARSADDTGAVPLSRPGTDADFAKLVLSGRYRAPLGEAWALTVNGRAQTSFGEPLAVAEQFGIATEREISPLDTGTLTGDSGWVLRGEVAREWVTEAGGLPLGLSPYAFAATGAVTLAEPGPGQRETTAASAFGVGLDLFTPFDDSFSNAALRIELGRGVRDDDEDDRTALSIAASYRF
ncbi:ShlB/FhaC/HecB family hemolysin secretion/activation protein [Rhodovulum sp. 12E13]|uniref:ShlB/FhaC/HecB family hemolysin secretion/activation protein n=1 Tax=Rhodovulum sp. 12E13 TaxID=2203891 RepID=UPI00131418E9|nr:ShlB/FhaC/HecB family hemolysin secretion/activation protein [Rhodovulum sp. 12E13]